MVFKNIPTLRNCCYRALTLIEMVVAVSLLVVVILAVGLIFQGASKVVGVSQTTMADLSNMRAIQDQIDRDVSGMDKNSFLVIRSGVFKDSDNVYRRCDLVSFISYGSFPHRTGRDDATNPFTDNTPKSTSAFVTWGQLAMENAGGPMTVSSSSPVGYLSSLNQIAAVPLDQVPTGMRLAPSGELVEGDLTLGRNAMLLFPKNTATNDETVQTGIYIGAFQDQTSCSAIDYYNSLYYSNPTPPNVVSPDSVGSHITQSRIDVAATTPSQIMSYIVNAIGTNRGTPASKRYEAERFCYRHAAVRTPYDGIPQAAPLVNGYFRMHPIALQGVSSFAIEWADGTTYAATDKDPSQTYLDSAGNMQTVTVASSLVGSTRWFGWGAAKNSSWSQGLPSETPANILTNDQYAVIFSYDTLRKNWPASLRLRYHVADPSGRVPGGRDFVQVVKLPK